MDWEKFSKKCAKALGDNLIGIHLFDISEMEESAVGQSGYYAANIVLKQINRKILKDLCKVGSLFKDESGYSLLSPKVLDELKKMGPIFKLTYIKHAKTIYGKAAADLIEMPRKEELSKALAPKIKLRKLSISSALASFELWNNSRKIFEGYSELLQVPRHMKYYYFIKTGKYLASRNQLRSKGDPDLALVCDILDKYPNVGPEEIEKALWVALSLLSRVVKELEERQE